MVVGRARDFESEEEEAEASDECCSPYSSSLPPSELSICHPNHRSLWNSHSAFSE